MAIGAVYPTALGKQVEASINGYGEQLQTVIIIQQPVTLTLGIQFNDISGAGYQAGPNAPEAASAQIVLGETAVFGGHSNLLNGQISLYAGSTLIQTYSTDASGYYGYKYTNNRGSYVQIQNNGLYLSGGTKVLSGSYSQGSTITFVAKVGSASSNSVVATVTVPVNPPAGIVNLEGCNHQKYDWSTLSGSTPITTCSPIYFVVLMTSGVSSIQNIYVTYQLQGSGGSPTQQLLTSTAPSGSTFGAIPSQYTPYYGALSLSPGTYDVHWTGKYSANGVATNFTVLSILGYFGTSEPVDMRWWWGASVFIIGLVLAASGFIMVIPRKRGGP